jgi:hypothetical protein
MPEGIPLMILGITAAVLALISWRKISKLTIRKKWNLSKVLMIKLKHRNK